ncbi:MAG: proline racemase family protein [Mycobacteriales bacterium]
MAAAELPLTIETVDYHTAGEPFRIVTAGLPEIAGRTILDRREAAGAEPFDRVRRLLCHEPRGHADMYGCFPVPPDDAQADLGVLFWHKDGYSTACGHGTIALATWAVESGRMPAEPDGSTDVLIDVPSGRVLARVTCNSGRVTDVTFRNVGSWVSRLAVEVATARGPLSVDVAWGGAYYACLAAADVGLSVNPRALPQLIELSREIKAGLAGNEAVRHRDERLSGLYGCIWFDPLPIGGPGRHQRNVTVFADGEVDRSPCGSGTSARLAVLHARGQIAAGESLRHDGIVGTTFVGRVVSETVEDGRPTVVTEVTGQAFRTGEHRFSLDPRDPLGDGFTLR